MNPPAGSRSLVVERLMAHPPEKVWRVLTQSHLIAEWLMENDFAAEVGRRFTVRASPLPGWSGVTHCEVVAVEAPRRLAYRWADGTESESGLRTLVAWTLTPLDGGTLLRMEQTGFPLDDRLSYGRLGAKWRQALRRFDQMLAGQAQDTSRERC